jgi:hypothetical protein
VAELGKSYYVVDRNGRLYGPADMATLAGWAHTRRLTIESLLQDPETGQTIRADSIPELRLALTSPPPGHGSGCFSIIAVALAVALAGAVAYPSSSNRVSTSSVNPARTRLSAISPRPYNPARS